METLRNANRESVTLNFNLREPRGNKCTPIYAVIKIGGKQIKVPIGAKICPWHWDKKRQLPRITSNMTEPDRSNALEVLTTINKIHFCFSNSFLYIYNVETDPDRLQQKNLLAIVQKVIKNKIEIMNIKAIPPRRSITASKLLKATFIKKYGTPDAPRIKQGSYKSFERKLNEYVAYLKDTPNAYDSVEGGLTRKAVYNYKEYLQKEAQKKGGLSSTTIAEKCNVIVKLINEIANDPNHERLHLLELNPIKIEKAKRDKDDMKNRAVTEDQRRKIFALDLTSDKRLSFYRDVMEMQLLSGVRVSDLPKLFAADYQVIKQNGQDVYVIETQKKGTKAYVIADERLKELQRKYEDSRPYTLERNTYSERLKQLFEMAGLTEPITWETDKNGKKVRETKRLCDAVSTHWLRHTFITDKLRQGVEPSAVAKMAGHKDMEMINKVYGHLTSEDNAKQIVSANQTTHKADTENDPEFTYKMGHERGMADQQGRQIKDMKDALIFLGADYMDIEGVNNMDELCQMAYIDYPNRFAEHGISVKELKGIYNTPNSTLKQKRAALDRFVNECRERL